MIAFLCMCVLAPAIVYEEMNVFGLEVHGEPIAPFWSILMVVGFVLAVWVACRGIHKWVHRYIVALNDHLYSPQIIYCICSSHIFDRAKVSKKQTAPFSCDPRYGSDKSSKPRLDHIIFDTEPSIPQYRRIKA